MGKVSVVGSSFVMGKVSVVGSSFVIGKVSVVGSSFVMAKLVLQYIVFSYVKSLCCKQSCN